MWKVIRSGGSGHRSVVVSLRGGEALLRQALSACTLAHTRTHSLARAGWRDLCARPATGRLFPPPNKSRPSVVPIRFDWHGPAVWQAGGPWPAHEAIIRWQLRFTGESGHQCLHSAGTLCQCCVSIKLCQYQHSNTDSCVSIWMVCQYQDTTWQDTHNDDTHLYITTYYYVL